MNRRIELARKVISPLVKQYSDLIVGKLSDAVPQSPEVVEVNFSPFFDAPLVRGMFQGYGLTETGSVGTMIDIVFNEQNNYHLNAFKTGNNTYDEELNRILQTRGLDWVKANFIKYFTNGEELQLAKPTLSLTYTEQLDAALVVYALAHYLYQHENNMVPGNMTQNDYDKRLLTILGRTSQIIEGFYQYRESLNRNRIVSDQIVTEGHVLHVYGNNYREYLKANGSNTALMGHARKRGMRLSIETLVEQREQFEKVYDREVTTRITEIRMSQFEKLKAAASSELIAVIDLIPEDVIQSIPELSAVTVNVKEVLLRRGQDYIKVITGIDETDPYHFALRIITVGVLPELELFNIYEVMERYLEPGQGFTPLTPKQAVFYAVVEELVKFFLSQVSLSDK